METITPLRDLIPELRHKTVLILGTWDKGDIREIVEAYGLNKVGFPSEIYEKYPSIYPSPKYSTSRQAKVHDSNPQGAC